MERRTGITGLVFVVVFVASFLLGGTTSPPGSEGTAEQWRAYFLEAEFNPLLVIVGSSSLFVLLWFSGNLRALLRAPEEEPGRLSALAFGGSVIFVTLLWAGFAAFLAVPGTQQWTDAFHLDVNTAMLFENVAYWLIAHALLASALFMGAASLAAHKTAVFPSWLAWVGLAFAALAVPGMVLAEFALVLPVLWVTLVSVVLIMRVSFIEPASDTFPDPRPPVIKEREQ